MELPVDPFGLTVDILQFWVEASPLQYGVSTSVIVEACWRGMSWGGVGEGVGKELGEVFDPPGADLWGCQYGIKDRALARLGYVFSASKTSLARQDFSLARQGRSLALKDRSFLHQAQLFGLSGQVLLLSEQVCGLSGQVCGLSGQVCGLSGQVCGRQDRSLAYQGVCAAGSMSCVERLGRGSGREDRDCGVCFGDGRLTWRRSGALRCHLSAVIKRCPHATPRHAVFSAVHRERGRQTDR